MWIAEAVVMTKLQRGFLLQINLEFLTSYNVYKYIPLKYAIVVLS